MSLENGIALSVELPNWTMLMQKVMTHQQKPPTIPDTVLVSMAFFVRVDLLWGGGGGGGGRRINRGGGGGGGLTIPDIVLVHQAFNARL